ncbi:MAG: hypothetical protein R3C68_13685 [Myxococcota bacterium]
MQISPYAAPFIAEGSPSSSASCWVRKPGCDDLLAHRRDFAGAFEGIQGDGRDSCRRIRSGCPKFHAENASEGQGGNV